MLPSLHIKNIIYNIHIHGDVCLAYDTRRKTGRMHMIHVCALNVIRSNTAVKRQLYLFIYLLLDFLRIISFF